MPAKLNTYMYWQGAVGKLQAKMLHVAINTLTAGRVQGYCLSKGVYSGVTEYLNLKRGRRVLSLTRHDSCMSYVNTRASKNAVRY